MVLDTIVNHTMVRNPVKNQKITGEAHCQPPCVYFGYRIKPDQNAKPTPKYGRPLSLSG